MPEIPSEEDLRSLFEVHMVRMGVPFLLFSHAREGAVGDLKDIEPSMIERQDMIWERFLDFVAAEERLRFLDVENPDVRLLLFPLVSIFLQEERLNTYRRNIRMQLLDSLNDSQVQSVRANFPEIF